MCNVTLQRDCSHEPSVGCSVVINDVSGGIASSKEKRK